MGFLQDKTAVIACAGSIGFGIAAAYAKEGCNLVITARDMKELAIAKERLESEHGVKVLIAADAGLGADDEAVANGVIDRAVGSFGRIDVLVNCARSSVSDVPLTGYAAERFDLAAHSGLREALRYMRACHSHLKETGGAVINLAPSAVLPGEFGKYAYAAAKEGICGLTRAAAEDWGPDGISVSAICPIAQTAAPEGLLECLEAFEGQIARAAVRLVSPELKHLSGEILTLEGGMDLRL